MVKLIAAAVTAVAVTLSPLAFAQGEVGPVKPARPAAQVSPQEKEAGKSKREAEGTAAARQQPPGEVGPGKPAHTGTGPTTTRSERKADAKAANEAMNKSSMPQRGELGQTQAK